MRVPLGGEPLKKWCAEAGHCSSDVAFGIPKNRGIHSKMGCPGKPGKWRHGPKPAVSIGHTHVAFVSAFAWLRA